MQDERKFCLGSLSVMIYELSIYLGYVHYLKWVPRQVDKNMWSLRSLLLVYRTKNKWSKRGVWKNHRMTHNFFWPNFQYSVVFSTNHRIFCILWFLPIICHRISCILISLISLIPWNGSTFLFTNQIGSNLVQSLLTTVPSFPSNFWNFQFEGQILEYYFSRR